MSTIAKIDQSHAAYLEAERAYAEGYDNPLLDYLIDSGGEALCAWQNKTHLASLSESDQENWLVEYIKKNLRLGCLAPFRFGQMVSPERLKEVVITTEKSYVPVSLCEVCKGLVGYQIRGDKVWFDGGCACHRLPCAPRRWSDPAGMLNIQRNKADAEELARAFGFVIGAPLDSAL